MSLGDWLAARTPEAPVALRQRIAGTVAEHPEWERMPVAEALLVAGETLLRDVLAAAPKDRAAALDLLAADACVTYAFEAAAEAPGQLRDQAEVAMRRIARLVESSNDVSAVTIHQR